MAATRIEQLLDQLDAVRAFTKAFLEDLSDEEWFWQPPGLATHIAWQVGHLTIAEYGLCLHQVRGGNPDDASFLPERLKHEYGIGSTPAPGADRNLPLDEMRTAFEEVHRRTLTELATVTDDQLAEPVKRPRPMFRTKGESIWWSSHHECVHAGQIALLRRQMGKAPLR